jgi:hydrogenase maturation protease
VRHCIVVGLGNPILGDDGVAWRVTEEVERLLADRESRADVDRLAVGGLTLMERLEGYDHAVIVDAIQSGAVPIGTARRLRLEELADPTVGHTTSAHDVSLATALAAGRALGAHLPHRVIVVAVEIPQSYDFGETLSPEVAAAVPSAAHLAVQAVIDADHHDRGADP